MRMSLLFQREPFGKILERTLADFLAVRFGQPFRVTWRQGTRNGRDGSQSWLCNPYLNIIFRPGIQREPLLPAIYEFSRSARPWRTPLNMLYVALATGRIGARCLANATVDIEPPLFHAEEMVIIGGNHHIRLLDYHRRCCCVITKSGFCDVFRQNEIAVRRSYPYLPAPRIVECGEKGNWYSEELILGTPVNRLKDQRQAREAVRQIVPRLFALYESTQKTKRVDEYVGNIVGRIDLLIGRNHLLSHPQRENLKGVVKKLARSAVEQPGDISIVQAHGDFQPANILVGDGGPWLIDWEYTTRRQSGYDGLVHVFSSRRSSGLALRFREALAGSTMADSLLSSWPGMEWRDHGRRRATLALFLLEEMDLKLTENDNPLFTFLDAGFQSFSHELASIIPLMESC
ncbi:MAG TPA: hypothetical protein DDY22_05750 [Geobacter sp.]|nr:hypothetical protein [Geobacter sp.]